MSRFDALNRLARLFQSIWVSDPEERSNIKRAMWSLYVAIFDGEMSLYYAENYVVMMSAEQLTDFARFLVQRRFPKSINVEREHGIYRNRLMATR